MLVLYRLCVYSNYFLSVYDPVVDLDVFSELYISSGSAKKRVVVFPTFNNNNNDHDSNNVFHFPSNNYGDKGKSCKTRLDMSSTHYNVRKRRLVVYISVGNRL